MVRCKNRYIIVEVNVKTSSDEELKLNHQSLHDAILQKVQQMHGDFGVAAIRSGFTTKYCNENTRIAIVRTRHGPHRLVASCLPLINVLDKKNVNLVTLNTSATIRQCFKFLLKYQQSKLDIYCASLQAEEEAQFIEKLDINL